MSNNNYLKYFNLSYQFFLIIIISGVFGYFIDNYLNLGFFIFTFISPILGFFYSLYRVYKSMK